MALLSPVALAATGDVLPWVCPEPLCRKDVAAGPDPYRASSQSGRLVEDLALSAFGAFADRSGERDTLWTRPVHYSHRNTITPTARRIYSVRARLVRASIVKPLPFRDQDRI